MIDRVDDSVMAADGRQIGFLARGPADGRPVMYLHGTPGSRLEQLLTFPDAVLQRFDLRVVSIDRPGHGKTDSLPASRVERARDLITVADHLDISQFVVVGVSCGGSNALTVAAVAPDRVRRVVLCCGQMPYDDEVAIAQLEPSQAAGLPFLRQGRSALIEDECNQTRLAVLKDPVAAFADGVATLSSREKTWFALPWVREAFEADMREGFRISAEGYIDDGLIMVTPFEIDPAVITCPVRAIHGTIDDWEPVANLRRILIGMQDAQVFALEGMNHFGSIMYPDLLASLCIGDP